MSLFQAGHLDGKKQTDAEKEARHTIVATYIRICREVQDA